MVYSTVDTPGYPPYSTQIAERTTGLTLDLAILNEAAQSHSPYAPDGNYAWLSEHAADYGFIVRYPADKKEKTGMDGMSWHFRYVGAPHAKYMAENNLCLEEYLELLQDHPWDSEHLTATVGGVEYEMYYVPVSATGATTDVKYPVSATGATPIISGDNKGGFVVAVVKE
jgi:D-alanyl-D-alanine carboxypeptidase